MRDAGTCPSTVYNLIYGPLGGVASYALSGSECSIGSGSFSWSGVPADDLWYLVVGGDGAGIESRWGDSTFGERGGLTPSGECATVAKNVVESCPN